MSNSFQRKGATSNTHVGRQLEKQAKAFFEKMGIPLDFGVSMEIGINGKKKPHKFDLGNDQVLVECKSHTWTEGGNVPSAKMTTWDQAMFLFHAAPKGFRKIFFVLRDLNAKRKKTLAQYYIETNPHLIPNDVEIWEYDETAETAERIKPAGSAL